MSALVPTGAPVSILIDHGLSEEIAEKLIEAGVGTVEKLGSMTPEELEAISGIEPSIVEKILVAVNSYYAQFEQQSSAAAEVVPDEVVPEEVVPEETPELAVAAAMQGPTDEFVEPVAQADGDGSASSVVTEDESGEDSTVPKKEFDTIKDSGEVS